MPLLPLLLQTASLGDTGYGAAAPIAAPPGRPTLADQIAAERVDRAKWHFDTARNKAGWHNDELQYYADGRRANVRIERGALVIEARAEDTRRFADSGGQRYTSARLVSQASYGYGFYEFRARLPCGRGIWPALWLLPPDGKWPDEGEIDVMEMVGWDPNVIHATLHTQAYNHARNTQRGAQRTVPTACTAWHRYQLDWHPDAITVGIDGRAFMRVANDRPGGKAGWPFTRPYRIILNVAVGGGWGGQKGVDDAAFPQAMRLDYVRYWRR